VDGEIQGARVLTPEGHFTKGRVRFRDGLVVEVTGEPAAPSAFAPAANVGPSWDVGEHVLAPGFIDLQLNGGFGFDFTLEPSATAQVAARLPELGVTAFLPTRITASRESTRDALKNEITETVGATPLGWHIEGPFIAETRRGAHPSAWIRPPSAELVREYVESGRVKLVTLAPELPGALAAIETLVAAGIVVSLGHSEATFAEARAGIDAGARYATHLFNAMSPLGHREPGLVGAVLADQRVIAGFIADTEHVHPGLFGVVARALGPGRLNLVSDGMAALGMPSGRYPLGEQTVSVDALRGRASLWDAGRGGATDTLAGSVLTLSKAVTNWARFGEVSLGEALSAVTRVPADLLGDAKRGRIRPGARADFVELSAEGSVVRTWVGGALAYERP
jgi:N-acetylglucosamine-6-phosphate deacetylase